MKKYCLNLMLAVLVFSGLARAEATGFTVETHATSEYGTTYRVYATFDDPNDWLSSVYGLTGIEGNVPMSLLANPGSSIFQANNIFGLNALFGQEVNPIFFPPAPDMQYDSWLTIGAENNAGDGGTQSVGMTAAIASFNAGTGFDNCGGAWFVASLSGSQPDWTAGDDLKVLLAQITMTDDANGDPGHFSFQFNIQYKTGTGPSQQFYGGLYNSADFIMDTDGCTVEGACNYSASALTDDGSCAY